LGQVSGGIAHEIRNPLNAVKTSTYYLLNAKTADEAKRREYLERIDRQVTAIDNVITALSDVAKLPEPKLGPVEPEVILAEAIQGIALPPNVTIEMDVPPAVRAMRADEFQIPIVFRNLVRNARDAMPDGGTIKVSARQLDDKIAIDVTDAGIGIEAEQLERILEPLYSTKARGMGLGLAICNAIIRKNGGQLHFRSEPGQGSTFTVELAVSHE
jgi:two-component system sensor kinase FixL